MAPVASQEVVDRCIRECLECLPLTSRCADACLRSDQVKAMERCVRLCLDCADLCGTCIEMLGRNSDFARQVCETLAAVCDACAAECDRHAGMDDIMRRCAEACRRCADACAIRGHAGLVETVRGALGAAAN